MIGERAQKIIQLRKENPLMNSVEIGKAVGGVSKQYVHKILKREGLNTYVPKQKKFTRCAYCNEPTPAKTKVCPGKCHFNYYNLKVACTYCHLEFYLSRSTINYRHRQKNKNIFCSRKCLFRNMRDR